MLAATGAMGAMAGPAGAMAVNGPVCNTRVASPALPSASCGYDSPTDWALISVETTGSVDVTVSCNYNGYYWSRTRTFTERGNWSVGSSGTCSVRLNATGITAASATAVPWIPPIIGPDPA
jgi:hypothetical protein